MERSLLSFDSDAAKAPSVSSERTNPLYACPNTRTENTSNDSTSSHRSKVVMRWQVEGCSFMMPWRTHTPGAPQRSGAAKRWHRMSVHSTTMYVWDGVFERSTPTTAMFHILRPHEIYVEWFLVAGCPTCVQKRGTGCCVRSFIIQLAILFEDFLLHSNMGCNDMLKLI